MTKRANDRIEEIAKEINTEKLPFKIEMHQLNDLGVDIAESLLNNTHPEGRSWEIQHLDARHGDLEYVYYVWQAPLKTTWISIFEVVPFADQVGECIFVGEPQKLIDKYKQNTNYDGE